MVKLFSNKNLITLKKTTNSINLYTKFLNHFLKKGKKKIIRKKIETVFFRLSKEFLLSYSAFLLKVFKRLKTFVEIKRIKKRRRVFLVPIALKRQRRVFLSLKWLSISLFSNKSYISFFEKLYLELRKIFLNHNCQTFSLLRKNNKQATQNRINLHYRW